MRRRSDPSGLLRWYPRAWRERYGHELAALMEDHLQDRRPSLRFRLSMACAGLRERAHHGGLLGEGRPPAERVRAGSLLVLWAWAAFVIAGANFSKLSEHFAQALPAASRAVPQAAFLVVQALAGTGAILVLVGALAAFPAFVRFLRAGRWPNVRRQVLLAVPVTGLTVVATVGLGVWARSLSTFQRNGGSFAYELAFLADAALIAATLVLWTVATVATARHLDLSPRLLALEATLASALALAMAAMTAATAVWWGALARSAPWFLHGTALEGAGSPIDRRLLLTMVTMLAAVVVAAWGVIRIGRSWSGLRAVDS